MNNKKNLEIFKIRLNDFSDFKNDIIDMTKDEDYEEREIALDYISKITSNEKSFLDFNFLDFFNTINEFCGDIADGDLDLSWSMYDNLQDALYQYIYNELIERGISDDYLDSSEDIYEGSWGEVANGFWIECKELFGEVINYTITPEFLSNDELLIESLDEIVDSIYTKIK